VTGNKITIDRGFQYKGTKNMTEEYNLKTNRMIPPMVEFTLPSFRNPRTKEPTGPFNVTVYDADHEILYVWNSTWDLSVNGRSSKSVKMGPAIQMTSAGSPEKLIVTPKSTQNGAVTDYEFTVTTRNYLKEGDSIVFTLPDPFYFSEATQVEGLTRNLRKE
jgi:hypothetical protein